MLTSTPSSVTSVGFAGSSPICTAARDVLIEDTARSLFAGCRSPIALAVMALLEAQEVAAQVAREAQALVHRNLTAQFFTGSRSALALAVLGVLGEDEAPTVQKNLTAQWLQTNGLSVYPALVATLSAKMKRSRELGVVEDHVQTFLTRLVERDTLANYIATGAKVQLSVLRVWAYQSACTELRRWGVDASLRATRAAKTSREVQQGKDWRVVQSADTACEVLQKDGADTTSATDLYSPTTHTPEDVASRQSRVDYVRASLVRMGHAHLVPVVDGLLAGDSVSNLMATHKVSASQLRTVLQALPS